MTFNIISLKVTIYFHVKSYLNNRIYSNRWRNSYFLLSQFFSFLLFSKENISDSENLEFRLVIYP